MSTTTPPPTQSAPRFAGLVATGRYVPPIEVSNDDLRLRFAESNGFVDKMEASTGIVTRWLAPESMATSDLALEAAKQALGRAGWSAENLDLIILGTDSPDFLTPATSVVLQHKLGAKNAGTFDIGCACASFPTGLATAAGWIAANPSIRRVLVVGVYRMSRLADPQDPMVFFYGDGAGAALLEAQEQPGFLAAATQADGSYANNWGIFAGGTVEPASVAAVEAGRTQVRMLERYPPEVNHEGWPKLARTLCANAGIELDAVDLWIFTQVRKPSLGVVMENLGLPVERAWSVMEKWGYTGSACLGMAFDDAVVEGQVPAGSLVAFVGSGVGYNQAGALFRVEELPR